MHRMTDLVFEAVLAQDEPPMIVGSSSVHAVDGLYDFNQPGFFWTLAERQFGEITDWPERISAAVPAHPINDYGREKAHVEEWVQKVADLGHSAVAMRWGGVNPRKRRPRSGAGLLCRLVPPRGRPARLVHACFQRHCAGDLPSGAHYFAISDNTYNIFDIETPRREVGYDPVHNAETYY